MSVNGDQRFPRMTQVKLLSLAPEAIPMCAEVDKLVLEYVIAHMLVTGLFGYKIHKSRYTTIAYLVVGPEQYEHRSEQTVDCSLQVPLPPVDERGRGRRKRRESDESTSQEPTFSSSPSGPSFTTESQAMGCGKIWKMFYDD